MIIDKQTHEIVTSFIGPYNIINDYRKDSIRTGVIELLADSKRYFVKIHNRLSRWNPEVYAYKNWTKQIHPFVPTLVAPFNTNDNTGIT